MAKTIERELDTGFRLGFSPGFDVRPCRIRFLV